MKAISFKPGRWVIFATAVIFSCFSLTGCIEPELPEDPNSPENPQKNETVDYSAAYGAWSSSYGDTYVISAATFSSYATSDTTAAANYSLNIVEAVEVKDTENKTYILYCQSPETYTYSGEYNGAPYEGTYYTKDSYTAVYVQVLTSTVLGITTAYNSSLYKSYDDSLETVKNDFTVAGGYFGNPSSPVEYGKAE